MSKYIEQVTVRMPPELKKVLFEVCDYEHTKHTELIRELIRKKIQEVTGTRTYQTWLRKRGGGTTKT